jgi:hypothetical protein
MAPPSPSPARCRFKCMVFEAKRTTSARDHQATAHSCLLPLLLTISSNSTDIDACDSEGARESAVGSAGHLEWAPPCLQVAACLPRGRQCGGSAPALHTPPPRGPLMPRRRRRRGCRRRPHASRQHRRTLEDSGSSTRAPPGRSTQRQSPQPRWRSGGPSRKGAQPLPPRKGVPLVLVPALVYTDRPLSAPAGERRCRRI